MHVIVKWNGISKFCEWNFNSLDLAAIIKKSTFDAGYKGRLYYVMVRCYTCRFA
jgi:hypothetical protein